LPHQYMFKLFVKPSVLLEFQYHRDCMNYILLRKKSF
jgi:hypothetical protein